MFASPDHRSIRGHLDSFAGRPEELSLDAIRDAIARADYAEAFARAFGRAAAAMPLPAVALRDLLPGSPAVLAMLYLVAVADGDVVEPLLELAERDRAPRDPSGRDLEVAALWAAWQRGRRDELHERVVRAARLRLVGSFGELAAALVVDLVRTLDDAELSARVGRLSQPEDGELVEIARAALAVTAAEVVARIPLDPPTRAIPGFTLRAPPRPNRNDPCPCGSGQKYKRCCVDRAVAAATSPIAGMSWCDYLRVGASRMSREQIDVLPLRDLSRVDLTGLQRLPLLAALRRFVSARRWDLAARAVEAIAAREPDGDEWRAELIGEALFAGELEVARAEEARLVDRAVLGTADRLRLDLDAPGADRLALIEERALAVVRDDDPVEAVEIACAVLDVSPGLGVLLARSMIGSANPLDVETLLETVEDARARLGLPPGDRGWDLWAAIDEDDAGESSTDEEAARLAAESRRLAAEVSQAQKRNAELERELDALRAQLVAGPEASAAPAADPAERRALRHRIETLEVRIREGNEERLALRHKLAAAAAGARRGAAAPDPREPDDDPADELPPAEAPTARQVLVPAFERAAADAIGDLPSHVAAEAVRTAGALAAGDASAWSRVKQAQDLRPPLLMARVGIHHRILFRVEEGRLSVSDVVTRESLLHVLKRMRRS